MAKVVHVIGNGDWSILYQKRKRHGLKLCCNLPPYPVPDSWATCIVDFKFMHALTEGILECPGEWILGMRPQHWMGRHPKFHQRVAPQIKEFYLKIPKYAGNYTNFNCGHFAVYYAAEKLKADRIHMYGFDSIFDFNLRSCSDFYLDSLRDNNNNFRLSDNWRPIWTGIFKEFELSTKFILHHNHNNIKIPISNNVEIDTDYDVPKYNRSDDKGSPDG